MTGAIPRVDAPVRVAALLLLFGVAVVVVGLIEMGLAALGLPGNGRFLGYGGVYGMAVGGIAGLTVYLGLAYVAWRHGRRTH